MAKKIFLSLCFLLMLLVLADFGAKNISADFVKEAENKNYVLSTDPKTLAIQVENKASGYIWSSTIDNLSNQGLNASWQQFVSSAISIDYINNFDKQRSTNLASGAQISFLKQAEGFRANIHFRQAGIGLALVVTLTDKGIEIKVPQDSITESNLGRLVDLNLYPFLGASKGAEESGYLLIPDGSGAEIDYQDPIQMTNAYSQPYYGSDSGISPINLNDNSYPIRLPSYGRVNGTDAYMAYVKSGAEYGTLTATKAGLQTNFNWITSKFTYRAKYNQATSKSATAGVQMYQTKANPVDIDLIINFLSGSEANTTGIAQSIQAQLISEGILKKQTEKTPAMQLDFMGADTRPGLFWNSLSVFTHVNYIRSQLREAGLKNVLPSLEGFGSAGYSSSDTNPFPINDALGSPSDYKNLAQSYPNFTLGLSYFGKNKPDNIKDSNLLQSITGGNVQALAAKSYPELTARDVKYIKELGVKQVNVAGLGQDLSSDYSADPTNRSQAIDLQEKALANLAQAGISIDGEQSNLYAWKYLKSISYLPNNDSFFIYETRAVPFIQTVLKGYLPYYSQAANQVSDGRDWLLTNLMNGAMPSYELSEATSQAFEKTSLAYVYNTNYANLKTEILKDYKIYEAIAEATAGAEIVSRYNLTEDGKLTKTAYSNGTVILVNLSGNDYKSGSLSLDKYSYQLVKGEGK